MGAVYLRHQLYYGNWIAFFKGEQWLFRSNLMSFLLHDHQLRSRYFSQDGSFVPRNPRAQHAPKPAEFFLNNLPDLAIESLPGRISGVSVELLETNKNHSKITFNAWLMLRR